MLDSRRASQNAWRSADDPPSFSLSEPVPRIIDRLKFLILKPSSLGDIVQAMPVLRLIKQQHPESKVFWWVDSGLTGLFEEDPDVDGLIPFHRDSWFRPSGWRRFYHDIRWIRNMRFDWVVDLQALARSGSLAWIANGAVTVGLDDPREGARGLYDIIVPRSRIQPHAVDWYFDAAKAMGISRQDFTWIPIRKTAAASIRSKWPVEACRWVLLQPGARWMNKRWPAESFAAVVRQLASKNSRIRFAVLGSAQDKPLAKVISDAAPDRCLNLAGTLPLPEMIEWIRACDLMISNDTGPMHVAAALKKPVVAIFGPTDPARTGPYGQLDRALRVRLPCSPCFDNHCASAKPLECLHAVTPQMVVSQAQQILNRQATQADADAACDFPASV